MELGLKGRAREKAAGTEGVLTSSCMSSFDDARWPSFPVHLHEVLDSTA